MIWFDGCSVPISQEHHSSRNRPGIYYSVLRSHLNGKTCEKTILCGIDARLWLSMDRKLQFPPLLTARNPARGRPVSGVSHGEALA